MKGQATSQNADYTFALKIWAAALATRLTNNCLREKKILGVFQTANKLNRNSVILVQGTGPRCEVSMCCHYIAGPKHHSKLQRIQWETISAHSNDSRGNKPPHHNFDWPTLHCIRCFSLSAAYRMWSSSWASVLLCLQMSFPPDTFSSSSSWKLRRCKEGYIYNPTSKHPFRWPAPLLVNNAMTSDFEWGQSGNAADVPKWKTAAKKGW